MGRTRTGKKLLKEKKSAPKNIFFWPLFLLETLGRFVYKSPLFIFVFLKTIFSKIGRFLFGKIRVDISAPKLGIKSAIYIIILLLFLSFSVYFYLTILRDLPHPDRLVKRPQAVSTKILDRNNNLLYTIFDGNENRTLVHLDEIPEHVRQATIAIEDKDFYKHTGFSIAGIIRAVYRNVSKNQLQGGSTITQQLIKNALLTSEKTVQRKIKEIILSIEAELVYSKDQILQMYFNEVPYGGTAYGIEEASQRYFGKSVGDINLAEAALLAGLPAAPSKNSPFGANPKQAAIRQHNVLDRMVEDGYISKDEADEAKKERIVLAPKMADIKAPHFVMWVKDQLVEEYGQRMVEQGGLQVKTSLNLELQEKAQQIVTEEVASLANLRVGNGAALVTNPQNGHVLAMVGSKDYFNLQEDGNVNVTTALRQPGSAIKVVTYSLALSNDYTPATVITDSPVTYYSPGSPPYSPVNYDRSFHGNVSLRTALACSYNVPAVKTLASLGVDNMIELGREMGITTWTNPKTYGLSLTLGAGEVRMTDMAVVYGTVANLGERIDLQPILEVKDSEGNVLNYGNGKSQEVLDPKTAFLITDILKDNKARTPAFGPSSYLHIKGQEVAVKTGTTNDKRDNWTIGYITDRLTAVWVGNNDNRPMSAVASGITGASPIWNKIMQEILTERETAHVFEAPADLIKVEVCSWNGLLPCKGCPTKEEYFVKGTEPKYHCDPEKIKKIIEEREKKKKDKILEGVSTERGE